MINVSHMTAPEVLARLYNRALAHNRLSPVFVAIHGMPNKRMTIERANEILDDFSGGAGSVMYVDYLGGAPIKSWLGENYIDERGYDRDSGEYAALDALTGPYI